MTRSIYTVGHSNHLLEAFLDLLHARDIVCVVDVRSSPHSRYAVQFNREALERPLGREGIEYRWLGDLLGGRLVLPLAGESGRAFYQRLTSDPRFDRGLAELEALGESRVVAVMCSEGDPLRCHRAIVIGKHLDERGWSVIHIRPDGGSLDQRAVRDELVVRARPVQANLWGGTPAEQALDPYAQQENIIAPRWQGVPDTEEEESR
ncbi:MAG: DUF488 domain-containing protein [Anaerolineae bacterium]